MRRLRCELYRHNQGPRGLLGAPEQGNHSVPTTALAEPRIEDDMSTAGWTLPNDPLGAFCRHNHAALAGSGRGPLAGLTFAVKDAFDIAGHRTGFGNPEWLATHPPAARTALAVERLLAAGANMVGRTHCDELCYSLTGENVHYGTPVNAN